jgi:hypothetical protein
MGLARPIVPVNTGITSNDILFPMKRILAILTLSALAALCGCDSISKAGSAVREKIALREQPRTHTFKAGQRATYEAARAAVDQMGLRFVHGGPAQGKLEAVSGVSSNDSLRSARQITLKLQLKEVVEGMTEASLVLSEIIESDSRGSAGMGTGAQLNDTPLYEVFFRNVQQALDAPKK